MEKGQITTSEAMEVLEKTGNQIKEGRVTSEMIQSYEAAKSHLDKVIKGEMKKEEKRTAKNFLLFTLSMPNVGSWNGQWTGREKFYARVIPIKGKIGEERAEEILKVKNFYYNFGDGWGMNVEATRINAEESRKVKKNTSGFMGYDWAIDSIIKSLKIISD